jgi:NDP-sugar pyrophosphorylase family protein
LKPAQALVLTAGLGTRLRPLTLTRAKAAVPVAGEPLVRRILRWLAASDIRDLVLNLHHRPETIAREVGDGSDLGVRVRYSWEPRVLGSAGGPRHALPLLASRFWLVNGDTLTDLDLNRMAIEHERSGALVTMALIPNPEPAKYGGVLVDERGWIRGFARPGTTDPSFHFIGVQIAEARVFEPLPDSEPVSSVGGLYTSMLSSSPPVIGSHITSARFEDIGTPADYLRTSINVMRAEGGSDLMPGARSFVAPSARVSRTAIWDDVVVEDDAELVECVVADGVRIPAGLRLVSSAVVLAPEVEPVANERRIGELLVAPIPMREPL